MKKAVLKVLFKPLTWINKLTKKDDKLIFFYSNLGFRDNVKAFYDYLISQDYNKEYKIIVSINDLEKHNKNVPENVLFVGNKAGIKYFMKAKYAFYCFGKYPIKPSKKQMVVNLWHGTPLKKIGNLEAGCEKIDYNFFTKVITNSQMYVPIMSQIFNCKQEDVVIAGNPRNDEMFRENKMWDISIKRGASKVILWLPTYREYDENFLISTINEEQLEEINDFLKDINCRMIVKLHPLQNKELIKNQYSFIEFISEEELMKQNITVYTLLRNADGLITDYSSVYFDYMLLDRPIAFAVADIEEYKNQRGLIFENPKEYMPGMEIKNKFDVEKFISDIFNEQDNYRKQRKIVNDKINYYQDGRSCERIAEMIFGGKTSEDC